MSTDNAARFYWGKLDKAIAIFKAGNLEEADDICLQLCNEMRCPRPVFPYSRAVSADINILQIHADRSVDAPRGLQPRQLLVRKGLAGSGSRDMHHMQV